MLGIDVESKNLSVWATSYENVSNIPFEVKIQQTKKTEKTNIEIKFEEDRPFILTTNAKQLLKIIAEKKYNWIKTPLKWIAATTLWLKSGLWGYYKLAGAMQIIIRNINIELNSEDNKYKVDIKMIFNGEEKNITREIESKPFDSKGLSTSVEDLEQRFKALEQEDLHAQIHNTLYLFLKNKALANFLTELFAGIHHSKLQLALHEEGSKFTISGMHILQMIDLNSLLFHSILSLTDLQQASRLSELMKAKKLFHSESDM